MATVELVLRGIILGVDLYAETPHGFHGALHRGCLRGAVLSQNPCGAFSHVQCLVLLEKGRAAVSNTSSGAPGSPRYTVI